MSFVDDFCNKLNITAIAGYRLLVIADCGVRIEGHKGIYEISDDIIRVRVKNGSITVNGEGLGIKEISNGEIIVTGKIKGIEL